MHGKHYNNTEYGVQYNNKVIQDAQKCMIKMWRKKCKKLKRDNDEIVYMIQTT